MIIFYKGHLIPFEGATQAGAIILLSLLGESK